MSVITFCTDFGLKDWYAGLMKGVVLGINQDASVVDITHQVPAGDIEAGAFVLMSSYEYFPQGTVHCVVIDPGVGGVRWPVIVRTSKHLFVCPDNGVCSWAVRRETITGVWRIENMDMITDRPSTTFHGRDIFSPVAAYLSAGVEPSRFGTRTEELIQIDWKEPVREGNKITGRVVYVDNFGNAITNIPGGFIRSGASYSIDTVSVRDVPLCSFYQERSEGDVLGVIGSGGFLEISINMGNAAERLGLSAGVGVSVLEH
ncbi:MAG: SAM-dependent chlorinase/fluorinase [Verrucomicrobia bacterium]|nr:SAM-dependent chlorinase/fluorinase [Verrucomicrobiota bacterium]